MGPVDFVVVIGVVGSLASVVGLLIAAPGLKSKVIHLAYGLLITILASGAVSYQHQMIDARRELAELRRIEKEAKSILQVASDRTTSGSMAGFMLASLSFLEKHRTRFPDTYARAVLLCERSGCLASGHGDGQNSMTHFYSMREASTALEYLMKGLAVTEGGT
jgi:ArsR family metal-binding transcriptional regulator